MKKAIVLGAYGFIGAACVRALLARGFHVTCAGRSRAAARRAFPDLDWVYCDFGKTGLVEWKSMLAGADIVVNASGALQDGARDSLAAIHETAVLRIVEALAETDTRLIQISAAGVSPNASTAFFRTKANGDAIIMASALDWIVLRPVLVLGPEAYGGTALLRAAAALPIAGARIFAGARVQTVHVDDVAEAVAECADGLRGSRFVADLTEDGVQTFPELTAKVRSWLGYAPWRICVSVPRAPVMLLGRLADALGWLGWRSPLRTNALRPLQSGITGKPDEWLKRGGAPMSPLNETLQRLPASTQERFFARLYLALPASIGCLSLFWLLSGGIGFFSHAEAMAILTGRGIPAGFAEFAVTGGGIADIALGLAVLVRRWCRPACLGMIALSAAYLLGATVMTPDLWADPLGPMVKVLPAMMLALLVALVLEDR
ncbi:SDR family oxidoreductase [Roseibium sp. M-1]